MQPILSVTAQSTAGSANKDVAREDSVKRQDLPPPTTSSGAIEVSPDQSTASKNPNADQMRTVVEHLQKYLQQTFSRELSISFDKELGRSIIKIVDSSTKAVIRQFPPEEIIQLYHRIKAGQESAGFFLEEQA